MYPLLRLLIWAQGGLPAPACLALLLNGPSSFVLCCSLDASLSLDQKNCSRTWHAQTPSHAHLFVDKGTMSHHGEVLLFLTLHHSQRPLTHRMPSLVHARGPDRAGKEPAS